MLKKIKEFLMSLIYTNGCKYEICFYNEDNDLIKRINYEGCCNSNRVIDIALNNMMNNDKIQSFSIYSKKQKKIKDLQQRYYGNIINLMY